MRSNISNVNNFYKIHITYIYTRVSKVLINLPNYYDILYNMSQIICLREKAGNCFHVKPLGIVRH